jgi:hypothetical protein
MITLADNTDIDVQADRDEIVMRVQQSGAWPFWTTCTMSVSECETLLRALTLKLREASDY